MNHESRTHHTHHTYTTLTYRGPEGKSKSRSERQVNCSSNFIGLHTKRTDSIGQLSLTRLHMSVELKVSRLSMVSSERRLSLVFDRITVIRIYMTFVQY